MARQSSGSRPERSQRLAGGGLLGLLLRPALALRRAAAADDRDRGEEALGVVGPVLGAPRSGAGVPSRRAGQLLEPGLVVWPPGPATARPAARATQAEHEGPGRRPAAVEVDGADDGLHGVGQDRRLLPPAGRVLALAEQERRRRGRARRPPRPARSALHDRGPRPWPARPRAGRG